MAPIGQDRLFERGAVAGDEFTVVLGIETHGKRGRVDEITEHDRELAAFGGRCRGSRGRDFSRRCTRCGATLARATCRRVEDLPPVADRRDTDLAQIVGGERAQHLAVDVVVAERAGVLIQAKAAEPALQIEALAGVHAVPVRLSR